MIASILATLVLFVCGNFAVFSDASKSTTPPSGIQILDGLCMPRRTDRLVYRHKNSTHIYIAFDRYRQGSVTVYSWEVINAGKGTYISPMTEQTVLAVDFRENVSRDHIVGATSKRHHQTFKTRVQRKMDNCKSLVIKKHKRCKITSIIELLVRLKIRNISFNVTDCGSSGFWEKKDSGKHVTRKEKGNSDDGEVTETAGGDTDVDSSDKVGRKDRNGKRHRKGKKRQRKKNKDGGKRRRKNRNKMGKNEERNKMIDQF